MCQNRTQNDKTCSTPMKRYLVSTLAVAALTLAAYSAQAQSIPALINYQGQIAIGGHIFYFGR